MFTKMKKNFAKKGLITLWLLFTTIYTVYGVYNYFKFRVYQAGASSAISQVVAEVAASKCEKSTQLFAGSTTVNLIDISCLQQAPSEDSASVQ